MNQLTPEQLKWCKQHLPKGNWKVNEEGLVDVEGEVYLRGQITLQEFPVPFGKVSGWFDIEGCENLLTLEGGPREVGGYFDCRGCISLKNLKGAPKEVNGSFWCHRCTGLQSLEGAPRHVSRGFACDNCTGLPDWVHSLAKDYNENKISWEELLQLNEKFLQKPKLLQAKNLGLL